MADDSESLEDERQTELSSIAAIFPEIVLDPKDPYSASIDLPVVPSDPLPVAHRESAKATVGTGQAQETHYLGHLPDLRLKITLPKGYPASRAPIFRLSTSPSWLSDRILRRLKADGRRLWEDLGHDQVVYAYIDHLQQASESAFGLLGNWEGLQVSADIMISLLDYDINARRAAFEKETFECGVCLDPKKGTVCHRMIDCGHVFCRQCLQDFYNSAITEGNIIAVQCLTPDCAKNRRANGRASGKKRKIRTNINPSELLEIPLEHEIVKRYVRLKHKAELESDENTIYCPRRWCQGAARSPKHRKPTSLLEPLESSDADSEGEHEPAATTADDSGHDKLSICADCAFAFCNKCFQGWHGAFTPCRTQTNGTEVSAEDQASAEYVRLHTTPCPTCSAPAQKTRGCNHMICSRCHTHFCYLCSAWLEPENPYGHFNLETSGCHMRLWELDGDGGDVGFGFRRAEPWEPRADGADGADRADRADRAAGAPAADAENAADDDDNVPRDEPVAVAREGPLVLRIGQLPPPAPRNGRPARAAAAQRPNQPVAAPQEAAHRAWVQHFVQMALNDEEDQLDWDSDDEEDVGAWDIPVR